MSTPYIGSKISLISRLDIRYEGTLHSVDPVDSTISLSQVRSFGTEDRPAPVQVPARDQVYEFIIFKAADIKDLIVCETPKPVPSVDDITYDPAIVSISKPPTQGPRQPAPQQAAIDERSSAQDNSQASSPPHQIVPMQQPQRQQQNVGQLMGNFGQNIQRSYYNRTINQQPAQHQQYNNPPPRAYPAHQYRLPPPPIPPQYDLQQGQIRRGGHFNNNQQRQAQQPRPYHNHQQRNNQPPPAGPRFDGDFDFERANEQFRESVGDIAEKMAAAGLEDLQSKSNRSSARNSEERAAERIVAAEKPPARDENYYDKNLSFFDNISCEALEKEEGKNNRVDWKKERMTNQETFGNTAVRSHNYRRGGRGGGYGGQGYQHRGYFNNYHNNPQQGGGGGGQGYQRGGTRYYGGGGGRPQQQQEQNY